MDALSNIRLKRRTLLKGLGVVGLATLGPTFRLRQPTVRRCPGFVFSNRIT